MYPWLRLSSLGLRQDRLFLRSNKALEDSNGDSELAKQWLREQGSVYADKRNQRSTSQGQICLKVTNNAQTAFLVELNCETDFVAKTDLFKQGSKTLLETLETCDNFASDFESSKSDSVKQEFMKFQLTKPLDDDLTSMTVEEALTYLIAKTRENCNIGQVLYMNLDQNKRFGSYMHNKSDDYMGKMGALVVVGSEKDTNVTNIADAIAMHITAMKPTYLSKSDIPSGVKVNENDILEHQELISKDNEDNLIVKDYIEKKSEELDTKITIEDYIIFSCS